MSSAETAGTDVAPEQTNFVACGNYAPPETLSIVGTCMPPQELMAPDFSAETRERLGLTPIPVFEDHRARRIARHALTYLLARHPARTPRPIRLHPLLRQTEKIPDCGQVKT